MVFRLGGQHCAIAVADVREVVPYAWLDQPPGMPPFVQGVLNLGGAAVPVLRLDVLLGMPPSAPGLDASILVMKAEGGPLGLLVDHVDGVRAGTAFQFSAVDDCHSFQGCLAGELRDDVGNVAHLLSWRQVLLAEEGRRLEHFQRNAQERLARLAEADP